MNLICNSTLYICMICISMYDLSLAFCMCCTICISTYEQPRTLCTLCMVPIGTYDLRLTLCPLCIPDYDFGSVGILLYVCSAHGSVRYTSVRLTPTTDLSDIPLYVWICLMCLRTSDPSYDFVCIFLYLRLRLRVCLFSLYC